jgi:hypothetical protein
VIRTSKSALSYNILSGFSLQVAFLLTYAEASKQNRIKRPSIGNKSKHDRNILTSSPKAYTLYCYNHKIASLLHSVHTGP